MMAVRFLFWQGVFGAALLAMAALSVPAAVAADAPRVVGPIQVAQMPALLPRRFDVPESEPLPIDGVWMISTIGKRIHIERGRAYVVDPWLHMFVLQVQPDMVVMRNVRQTGAGQYTADDLPLAGPAAFTLRPDGNISVQVQSVLGPLSYDLIRQTADDPAALDAEIAALGGGAAPPVEAPPSDAPPAAAPEPAPGGGGSLADCKKLGIDPATGDIVCND